MKHFFLKKTIFLALIAILLMGSFSLAHAGGAHDEDAMQPMRPIPRMITYTEHYCSVSVNALYRRVKRYGVYYEGYIRNTKKGCDFKGVLYISGNQTDITGFDNTIIEQ